MLDDVEARFLIEKVLEDLFQRLFSEQDLNFKLLLDNFSVADLKSSLKDITNKLRSFDLEAGDLLPEPVDPQEVLEHLDSCLDILATGNGCQVSPGVEKRMAAVREFLASPPSPLSMLNRTERGSLDQLQVLRSQLTLQGLKDPAYKAAINEFREILDEIQSILTEEQVRPLVQALQAVLLLFDKELEQTKRSKNYIDFDGLQTEAKRLLTTHPDILRKYQEKFKYILVDEYQDTNALQDHLVTLLSAQSKLFIVGDRKQAIYGFRNADDRLLLQKEEELSKTSEGQLISLHTNFRSTDGVLGFINKLFEQLWQENPQSFEPLKAVRASASASPSVTVLQLPEEKQTAFHRRYAEAQQIVRVIEESSLPFKDIAILLRALSDVGIYEQALKTANVPYTVVRSGSFYQQQEIVDLSNFFKVVLNPLDNFVLASVLKSPLASVSDNALFWLIDNEEHSLFWGLQNIEILSELTDSDRDSLVRFKALLLRIVQEQSRLSLLELLQLIIKESDYKNILLLQDKGESKAGNLEKLVAMAGSYEQKHSADLAGFSQRLDNLIEIDAKESEVVVSDELENSVKIYTVHKAKGLEYSLVILPDLLRDAIRKRSESSFNLTSRGKLGCKLKQQKAYTFICNEKDLAKQELAEAKRLFYVACTRAKDRLVFGGIPELDPDEKEKSTPNWGRWLSESLEEISKEFWLMEEYQFVSVNSTPVNSTNSQFAPLNPEYAPLNPPKVGGDKCLRVLEPIAVSSLTSAQEADLKRIIQNAQPLPPSVDQSLELTVTQIMHYQKCPRYYYWRYFKGVDEFWVGTIDGASIHPAAGGTLSDLSKQEPKMAECFLYSKNVSKPPSKNNSPELFGTITHNILADYNFGQTLEAQWESILEKAKELSEPELVELRTILGSFANSELAQVMQTSNIKREISFVIPFGKHRLNGVIDLLVITPDGTPLIIDYKTNRWSKADFNLRLKESGYELQQQLYALAVQQILGSKAVKAQLFFLQGNRLLDVDVTEESLEVIRTRVSQTFKDLVSGNFSCCENDKACENCLYFEFCNDELFKS